jgi:hypothetical protein
MMLARHNSGLPMEQPELHPASPTGVPTFPGEDRRHAVDEAKRKMSIRLAARSLEQLRPQQAMELLAHGSILRSCAADLEEFAALDRATRSVGRSASLELLYAVRTAAATATNADQVVELAADQWSQHLRRLSGVDGISADEQQLLDALTRGSTGAKADDPYAWIFEIIATQAQALYGRDWRRVEFIVRVFSDLRTGEDRYPVRASTEPASERSPVRVVIAIDPTEFGPAAFAAIPGLLTHECLCHVAARPAGAVDNLSQFAEGFMHWAAVYYGKLWAPELGELALAADEHAHRVFEAIARGAPGPASARGLGERAARKVARRLEHRHGMAPGLAAASTANLAVRLNVAPKPLSYKDRFVRQLDREPQNAPLAQPVLEVITGSRDPNDLL